MYKLLIVDDEAIERDALNYIISRSDLAIDEIDEASNGQEAISKAAIFEPDIVIMDIRMPGIDGIESSKIIKKIKANTKIILLTAFDEFNHAHEAIKLGVEAFVVKPASNERILEVLKEAMIALEEEKKQQDKQATIEGKLKQVTKYLETEFLTSVIAGDLSQNQLQEYVDFMNIEGTFGFGFVIMMRFNQEKVFSNLQQQMIKKRIYEKVDLQMNRLGRQYFITQVRDLIYILSLGDDKLVAYSYQDKVKDSIVTIAEEELESNNVYLDMGIGDVKERIEDMWQSFSKAKSQFQRKDVDERNALSKDMFKKFIICIVECDEEHFGNRFEAAYSLVTDGITDIEKYKLKLYEFLLLFNQAIYEEVQVTLKSSDELYKDLSTVHSMTEGKEVIKDYCYQVFDAVKQQKSDKTLVIMDKLITYINNHSNENITLEQLSKMSGFSIFYLSKVFKKHVDMNFSDYLSFVRIRVAKRLLKNPSKSIKEISMEVGYIDPNYFARVFRKYVHMTPTEYRNKNLSV